MKNKELAKFFEYAWEYVENNWPEDIEITLDTSPITFDKLSSEEFIAEYCWVVYCSGFKVSTVEKYFPAIKKAFKGFDLKKINDMKSLEPVLEVFANKQRANGFLKGVKAIYKEGWPNFKKRLGKGGMTVLKELPMIGDITKNHLAKNIGLADVAKDDVWLVRLRDEFEANSVSVLVKYLAERFDISLHTVDIVLWRFCSEKRWRDDGSTSLRVFIKNNC